MDLNFETFHCTHCFKKTMILARRVHKGLPVCKDCKEELRIEEEVPKDVTELCLRRHRRVIQKGILKLSSDRQIPVDRRIKLLVEMYNYISEIQASLSSAARDADV